MEQEVTVGWTMGAIAVAFAVTACEGHLGATDGPGGGGDGGSTVSTTNGGSGGAAASGATGSTSAAGGSPPFHCDAATTTSPALGAVVLLDPADPHPGDTLTVIVKATNGTKANAAPPMQLEATDGNGTVVRDTAMKAGGPALYYYAVPNLALGDVCLLATIGGQPEISAKVTVTPRPSGPALTNGVYKVVTNHQFTCDEQPAWGNELHVLVLDEQGAGVPGAVVNVHLPDTTDLATIKNNGPDHPIPSTLAMDDGGAWNDYNWWPSSENGLLVLELSVAGAPSDMATEVTSGWWDTDANGCRYCPPDSPKNVFGHWSHRIVFQRDGSATTACKVPTDHAGEQACAPPAHIHHDPDVTACWPGGQAP